MADTAPVPTAPVANNKTDAKPTAQPPAGVQRVKFENLLLAVHPDVAELRIPTQTSAEFLALLADVEKQGQIIDPIKLARDVDGTEYIVDGLHRMAIAEKLGYSRGVQYQVKIVPYDTAVDVAMSASQRRNLTPGQLAAIGVRHMEVEQEKIKRNLASKARVTALLKQAENPVEITVPLERLSKGGDIFNTFSLDTIPTNTKAAVSKIRGVFEQDGVNYAAVDGVPGGRMIALKVVPLSQYREGGNTITNYQSRITELEENPELSFDGLLVNVKINDENEKMVLEGPLVVFSPDKEAVAEKKAKGKENNKDKAKKKASVIAAAKLGGGMSSRSLEMVAKVKNEDPEAYARLEQGENQPGTNLRETIHSAYARLLTKANAEKPKVDPKTGLADPDKMTIDEFVENHPLFALFGNGQLPDLERDIRAWFLCADALKDLERAVKQAKIRNVYGIKGKFALTINSVCNMQHPYKWELSENTEGGYTFKIGAIPKPIELVTKEAKPKTQGKEVVAKPAAKTLNQNQKPPVAKEDYGPDYDAENGAD